MLHPPLEAMIVISAYLYIKKPKIDNLQTAKMSAKKLE